VQQAGAERPGPGGDGDQVEEAEDGRAQGADQAEAEQPVGPLANTTGSSDQREARSKTKLATQAPIGTVTRTGWNGWPYGPASELTGSFAARSLSAMPPPLTRQQFHQ
jgi:hypothetical protein